jgi:hypothetical protein
MWNRDTLPRPSLLWLSRRQVREIRNKLIALFLSPGEAVSVRLVKGVLKADVVITPGVKPKFNCDGIDFYLVTPKDKNPYWEIHSDEIKPNVPFQKCFLSYVVKDLHNDFPFKPTSNYLIAGGAFIA